MRKYIALLVCSFLHLLGFAQMPQDYVIPVKISVDEVQPSITISWAANRDATSYTVKRKKVTVDSYADNFSTVFSIASEAPNAVGFTDNEVSVGEQYEYEISGSFATSLPAERSTYICAGINILPLHNRGSTILLCDSSNLPAIEHNLKLLSEDLVGDGWKVIRIDTKRSSDAAEVRVVKRSIMEAYNNNPDLKQVIIIGHVPVPYSGNIAPDGHTNHSGCWPADGYYGEMVNNWTDTLTVYSTPSTRPENINLPGDGKFDQSYLPRVQLAVGRIDFTNLPAFGMAETDLLNRYLVKNHLFRTGETVISKNALIEDNFLSYTEKFSQSAWKSFAAIVGFDNVFSGQYETGLLSPGGYLWSYGNGAGVYTGASGIGSTTDFVTNAYKTVFTQLFGSYFGDWDSQDNFMRASLASGGNTLACTWGGRPHWYFHHMSAGAPIGYSALLTMNNNGIYNNPGNESEKVHIGLMGDPSLRSSYVKPVQHPMAVVNNIKIEIVWDRSSETTIAGYYVYRSNTINGSFSLLNEAPVTINKFTDDAPLEGNNVYMIRTVRIDTVITSGAFTNNSTFYNLAEGSFDSVFFSQIILPLNSISFSGSIANCAALLQWEAAGERAFSQYAVEYSPDGQHFQLIGRVTATGNEAKTKHYFKHQPMAGRAYYRVKMIDNNGSCRYSNIILLPVNCSKNTVLVYPNPVIDILNINVTLQPTESTNYASLYDATGRLVCKKILVNGTNNMDLSNVPHGIYTLKVFINGVMESSKVKR